ncbi:hypothetical protein C5F52_13705 [Limnohabitans sp. TS-CS-82]|uniref:DUF5710 domain-containing protein n=1 Tax=Limnohabitans sp. TS-CS-82 TaxID=2094193 RepID=UPI000CF1F2C3|nr:DUF5710 domain-containing protein [Limnohabitans sp. TS-CS-82]PQA82641.1 hypothetical protein C5F52_13705 [Limnohabitans sp. TS-CS-82]
MRINLVTPFAEKDAVKALGARWDAAKKVWYVVNVEDLSPFMRWIPDLAAAQDVPGAAPAQPAAKSRSASTQKAKPVATSSPTIQIPHCGCAVLPWEHCEHSLAKTP